MSYPFHVLTVAGKGPGGGCSEPVSQVLDPTEQKLVDDSKGPLDAIRIVRFEIAANRFGLELLENRES